MIPRRSSGVSLIELMIALGVIALVLFALMSMIISTMNLRESQRELDIAKQAATSRIEEIKVRPWAEVSVKTSSIYSAFTVDGLSKSTTTDKKGKGSVSVDNTNPDLIDVEVLIEWSGVRGASRYSLRHMYTR